MKKFNKKGFTLIELLAVIAILAILLLLVTPNILSMFNSGKENSFVQQAERVLQAANTKYISESLKNNRAYVFSNVSGITGTDDLGLSNNSVSYCVSIDNKGNVTGFSVSDGSYSISKKNDNTYITVDDITAKTKDTNGNDTDKFANLKASGDTGFVAKTGVITAGSNNKAPTCATVQK